MNKHLQQRIEDLLARYDTATLATCGQAGPQISRLPYRTQQLHLYLFVPHGSDHLFNLESQPELVLLTTGWKLQGRAVVLQGGSKIVAPHTWQSVVEVSPVRLHVLSDNGQNTIETIDF